MLMREHIIRDSKTFARFCAPKNHRHGWPAMMRGTNLSGQINGGNA